MLTHTHTETHIVYRLDFSWFCSLFVYPSVCRRVFLVVCMKLQIEKQTHSTFKNATTRVESSWIESNQVKSCCNPIGHSFILSVLQARLIIKSAKNIYADHVLNCQKKKTRTHIVRVTYNQPIRKESLIRSFSLSHALALALSSSH